MNTPDYIEKQVVLKASLQRVWQAISDHRAFGTWFGAELDAPFAPGARITGRIHPTAVDEEIAQRQAPHTGTPMELQIERLEPPTCLAFSWAPGPKPNAPRTLVTFTLSTVAEGTLVKICESGFQQFPLEDRAKIFTGNEMGWVYQTRLLTKYLELYGEA